MSPGAQSMGQMCSLLIKKVVQPTEPEVWAVYELGQSWLIRTRNPGHKISYSPWKMATGYPQTRILRWMVISPPDEPCP